MSKSHSNLGSKELSLFFRELFDGNQMSEQLSALHKVHQKVDSVVILEHVLHVDQEGVVNSVKNIFLKLDVLHLLVLNNDVLSNTLHCIQLASGFVLNQKDFSKSTFSDEFAEFKIFEFGLGFRAGEDLLATTCHRLSDLLVHLIAVELSVFFVFVLLETQVIVGVSLFVSDFLLLFVVISVLGCHGNLRIGLLALLGFHQVFRKQSVLGRGHSRSLLFHVRLSSCVRLEIFAGNPVNRQVLVHQFKECLFNYVQHFVSLVRLDSH